MLPSVQPPGTCWGVFAARMPNFQRQRTARRPRGSSAAPCPAGGPPVGPCLGAARPRHVLALALAQEGDVGEAHRGAQGQRPPRAPAATRPSHALPDPQRRLHRNWTSRGPTAAQAPPACPRGPADVLRPGAPHCPRALGVLLRTSPHHRSSAGASRGSGDAQSPGPWAPPPRPLPPAPWQGAGRRRPGPGLLSCRPCSLAWLVHQAGPSHHGEVADTVLQQGQLLAT